MLSVLPGAAPEYPGASLAQEHTRLQEGALPPSTCPKQDAPSTQSDFLGIPLPVLCLQSWAQQHKNWTSIVSQQWKANRNNYFLKKNKLFS